MKAVRSIFQTVIFSVIVATVSACGPTAPITPAIQTTPVPTADVKVTSFLENEPVYHEYPD